MKKIGIGKKDEVIKEIAKAISNTHEPYDEKKSVIHVKRKIRTRKIHLKENFSLVFFINNALLQKEPNLKPINDSSIKMHHSLKPEDASWYTEWEYSNIGVVIRNSQMFRKKHGVITVYPEAFMVRVNNDSETPINLNLFDISERVRLVTNKHEYDLI